MDTSSSPSLWFSKRFLVAFVLFLCFVNFQILRNNVNITVVEMTSSRSITEGDRTTIRPPEFNWDTVTIGLVLSILAFGGLLSFLGGFLVDWLGGAMNSSLSMLIAGLTTLLHPAALYLDFRLFLACRFVTGMFESFFYVSIADIFARWFPKNERSTLISFSFNGTNVGVAVVYPFCGYLAHTWGWQSVFYVTGCISLFGSFLCAIIVKNRPSQDKWISKKELKYILEETESTVITEINHPYKSILTSGPVWSICIVVFAYMWISTVVGSCLPLYIKDLTQKNTNEIGVISSIPNIVFIVFFPIAGTVMSFWSNHSSLTTTRIHKIIIIFACVFSTVALFVITLIPNFIAMLLSIIVIQIVTSFMALIIELVPVSLHADSCSVIVGMVSVFLSIGAIISQSVTSFMVSNHTTQEWNNCFLLASSILLLTGVIFALYGSSEPQQWTTPHPHPDARRPSMISVHFHNDARKLPVRSQGLQLRRVSIKNSEIQKRVRKLSLKNVGVRKLSTRSLDTQKEERALSLGNFSFNKSELCSHEEGGVVTVSTQQRVIPIIEYTEIPATGFATRKMGSEPAFGNLRCSAKEKSARRSSLKSFDSSEQVAGGRRSSLKSVQFLQDQQSNSAEKPNCSNEKEMNYPEDEQSASRKSSLKSVQFSDDEHAPTTSCSNSDRSSSKGSENSKGKRRSSLKSSDSIKDGRRSSLKIVQFH